MKKKIVGYCRVSTENQKEEGTIDIQRQALKEFADKNNYQLVRIFEDEGVSGGLENRQGLSEMFDFLEANKDIQAVLIYKLDRLARDLYIQEHLIKKLEGLGKTIISTKEANLDSNDPMRKAFRQFMGIVSELEKSFITMRLVSGRINKIKTKKAYAGGGIALGYTKQSKDLAIDKKQSETVRRIFTMRINQHKNLSEIADILNRENVPTARGGKWYARTVKYILENPIYRGVLSYSKVKAKREDLAIL